jgi:hypothetical protein
VEAEVVHQPAGFLELGVGVGGEILGPQHFLAAPPHDEGRPLGLDRLLDPWLGAGFFLAVEDDRQLDGGGAGQGDVEAPPPEGGESPVVGGNVLRPAEQRRPARPVHGAGTIDAGERQRPGVGHRPPDGHVHTQPSQHPGEGDGDPFELARLSQRRLRHRA